MFPRSNVDAALCRPSQTNAFCWPAYRRLCRPVRLERFLFSAAAAFPVPCFLFPIPFKSPDRIIGNKAEKDKSVSTFLIGSGDFC